MPFPAGATTITLTGTFPVPVGGTARDGEVIFTPTAVLVDSTQHAIYSGGGPVALDASGHFSALLLCNDDTDIQPTGWRWRVDERPAGGTRRPPYFIDLPSTLGASVDLSQLAPVSAPDGSGQSLPPTGPAGGALTGSYPNPQLSAATTASFVTTTDPRLADARTPTAHAATHGSGGTDPVTVAQSQVTGLAASLAALLAKTGGTLTGDLVIDGANLTVTRADDTGGYRFRVTGSGLDLEIAGLDVFVSKWANADFTGAQTNVMRWEGAGPHLIGRSVFGTGPFDEVHHIDATTGVAGLGAKNALTNIRLAGRRATTGAPTTGTWTAGDAILDSAGAWYLCTADGTPGTWQTATPPINAWTPQDHGLSAWSFDPASSSTTGTTLSAGFIYLVELQLRQPTTLNKVHAVLGAAGSGLTASQCLAGYYDTAGNRVGLTADQSAVWNSAGNKAMNLLAPYSAPAGKVYAAFLFNGTTSPTFACGSTLGAAFTPGNANLTAGAYRFCRSAAGQTALPATITLSGYTPDANNVWAAAS
ncbi:hypothetical protein [Streptomyces sp. NPDC096311]|uniref:hypothetical protein n=1 Tax=Streptomyces sp. NPDC096311 TaxID=3366083 RepID=UPI00381A29ED